MPRLGNGNPHRKFGGDAAPDSIDPISYFKSPEKGRGKLLKKSESLERESKALGKPNMMIALPPLVNAGASHNEPAKPSVPGKAIQQSQFARAVLALPPVDDAGAGAHSRMKKQQQKERMAANSSRPGLLVDSIVSDFLSAEGSSVNQLLNFLSGGGDDFVASSAKAVARKKKKRMKESANANPESAKGLVPSADSNAGHISQLGVLGASGPISFSVSRSTFLTALPEVENGDIQPSLWKETIRKIRLMLSVTRAFYELIEIAISCGRLRAHILNSRNRESESPRSKTAEKEDSQAPLLVANLIGFNLENYRARKRHFVGTLSNEMRMALLKSPEEKTDGDADLLQKLTLNMPAFMKYDHTVRRALSRVIGYGLFGRGRVIVRQGHAAENFYFVLSGQVEVQKEVDNESFGLSVLESGESFGELALLHDVRRSATIVTRCETELLWVNKDDFIHVLKLEATKDEEEKQRFLMSIPYFAALSPSSVKFLANNSQMREVQPNVVLFAEGEAAGHVFIIKEGTGRLVKYVPFEEVYLGKKQSKYILLPHPLPPTLDPTFGSRKVGRFLCIQEVGPSDFFGEAAALAAMGTAQQHASMNIAPNFAYKQSTSTYTPSISKTRKQSTAIPSSSLESFDSKHSRRSTPDEFSSILQDATMSRFSLVSSTRMKCLLISRIDFVRCCTLELAKQAGERVNAEKNTLLDIQKLQETFLYNRHWRDVKRKILMSSLSEDAFKVPKTSSFKVSMKFKSAVGPVAGQVARRDTGSSSPTTRRLGRGRDSQSPGDYPGGHISNKRLPSVFDGIVDKLFGPMKSRHLGEAHHSKSHSNYSTPPRPRSHSAGVPTKSPSGSSSSRHTHRNTDSDNLPYPTVKNEHETLVHVEKSSAKVSFRSGVTFEREDTLSEPLNDPSLDSGFSVNTLWKGKGIMGSLRDKLRSNKEDSGSRSSSPTGRKIARSSNSESVEGPFSSQATLRAGTSDDLLKNGSTRAFTADDLSRSANKKILVSSPSLQDLIPSLQIASEEIVSLSQPGISLTAFQGPFNDLTQSTISVAVSYEEGNSSGNSEAQTTTPPFLLPISRAELDLGLVPLAIQPEPLLIPPTLKGRGNSSLSIFSSLRRSRTKSQTNLSRASSIKSKKSFYEVDSDGRSYRPGTAPTQTSLSPRNKGTLGSDGEFSWRKSFGSSSSFVYPSNSRRDSEEEVVVIESPAGSPPPLNNLSDGYSSGEAIHKSSPSLLSNRRSMHEANFAGETGTASRKSSTHLSVTIDNLNTISSKRSRSVDFGLHRMRSISSQPPPVTLQPILKNEYASLPRNINSISTPSLRRRPPQTPQHQVVETFTIYDKQEQPTKVVSPQGLPENSQGKVNQYLILQDIGRGSFGRVVLCRDVVVGRYYACKIISKSRLRKQFRFSGDHMGSIHREIAILKKLTKHPNVNALVEVLNDDNEDNLYMIFELCEYGPVMSLKSNEPVRPFDENLARKYFRDMVLGIEYLHSKKVIHRDLKPENLLLTANMIVQIADFGISHMFEDGQDDMLEDKNASPAFSPPEACGSKGKEKISGKAFDIWSLGVTLYCMVHGRCPFEDKDQGVMEVYQKILFEEPVIEPSLSSALKELLRGMMIKDPNMRWRLEEIRSCDWITNYGQEMLISTEENCEYEIAVTDQDIENAFSPITMFFSRIKNILKFRRMKSVSRSQGNGLSPTEGSSGQDDARQKPPLANAPSKGILRKGSWSFEQHSEPPL
ncbi:Calcium/calmodulin-dependent protein kinase kinase 1 [Phlyctochytrium planicorne]|nr:Calcium/calmodulin-dependent protein kinase kinase 1 [Phlyctochytrium planicorne]